MTSESILPAAPPGTESGRRRPFGTTPRWPLLPVLCLLVGLAASAADDEKQGSETPKEEAADRKTAAPAQGAPRKDGDRKAPSRPAPSAGPSPLRFDDFDLEKYHKPAADEAEDPEGEQPDLAATPVRAPGSVPAVSAPGTPGAKVAPPRRATAPRVPKPLPPRPPPDPLKAFREREAKEKFRVEQLQRARDRIAGLQSRLDYLQAKRNAIQNPAQLLAGQTRISGQPGDPPKPPPPPTPIQGPGNGLTAKWSPGKLPVSGIFPNLPPPQTDQDKENDKRMKTRDLLALVEDEIKGLEGELEQAQAELISIQTRFAQETGVQ